jgi:hypothetical protein
MPCVVKHLFQNAKHQIPSSKQIPTSNADDLSWFSLEFGAWRFFGVWEGIGCLSAVWLEVTRLNENHSPVIEHN